MGGGTTERGFCVMELGAIVLVLVTSAFDAVRDGIMKTGSWWGKAHRKVGSFL